MPSVRVAVTPSANAPDGTLLNVTGKIDVGAGVPFTDFGVSWTVELGVAYDSNDGFSFVKKIPSKPKVGWPAAKLLSVSANFGAQASVYSSRPTVYTNLETCRAHY
jgi:hypothetical protein